MATLDSLWNTSVASSSLWVFQSLSESFPFFCGYKVVHSRAVHRILHPLRLRLLAACSSHRSEDCSSSAAEGRLPQGCCGMPPCRQRAQRLHVTRPDSASLSTLSILGSRRIGIGALPRPSSWKGYEWTRSSWRRAQRLMSCGGCWSTNTNSTHRGWRTCWSGAPGALEKG